MEQVKLEQHQLEQIRFNALQSQIQPHFLYNTLECIHWQAIAEGNKEISTMVKALAKYYRICLSKRHDVIPIREEIEHIRNYMIIQNMRYDNIIGSEIVVESRVEESLIPKLTLQPLVENSIYHGMKVKEGKKGTLYLTAYKDGDEVVIKVSDTGTGMSQEQIDEIYAELRNIMISNIGTPDYVLKAFNTFSKATESYNLSSAAVRRCCFEIASSLIFSYMEESCDVEEGKLDALSKSLSSAGKEEACEITRMFIEQLIGKDEENVHYTISNAKHYIDEHLAEDISVSSIAANLYITPNYFSRLFKRITGEGCNEYIVRKRIEKAKSLLETTSIKTGKIAMMVGYRDTNYFSLAFKKHTGKSPTKYREEMQNT